MPRQPPRLPAPGRLAAAALLAAAATACTPAPELAEREAATPQAIAAALCARERPAAGAACANIHLPDRASEIAYAGCLDYNRRDLRPCSNLRLAYEDDLRGYLAGGKEKTGAEPPPPLERLEAARADAVHRTAAELYKASNSDADTFQAALLIPDIRRKVEAALGQRLTDPQLQALIAKNRADALYWYEYLQRLERSGNPANQ